MPPKNLALLEDLSNCYDGTQVGGMAPGHTTSSLDIWVNFIGQVSCQQCLCIIIAIEDARQAYMTAIKEKFTLKIRPVRFNYLGIPRRGITSFRLRLMGMFTNIISAMAKGLYKRGDTSAQDGGQVIIRGNVTSDLGIIQATEEKVWSVLEDNLLYQIILKAVHEAHLNLPDPPQHGAAKPKRKGRSFVDRLRKKLHLGAHTTTPSDGDLEEIFSVVMDSMNAENWETIKILLDDLILLINTDTGGQAELLDLQAGLVQGPSFNLLFCRLIDELETKFKMYYTNEEKVSAMKEDAIMTLEELLFQVLATIACYSGCFANEDDIPTASDESSVKKLSLAAKSKVMFVGTHRDLVSEEEFKRKDRALQALIKNTEFYKRGIVKFALEDQLMLTVNNMSGGEGEIREIRKVLERVIEQSFEQVDIPVTWLMLSLYIRKKNVRTMSLSDCEAAAAKFGINPQELQEVLWFLHHCIGVLLYYPEVEALKDTVICQMQVVYDSTSNLTKNVFTFERVGKMACERFREKAQFMLADVKKAMSGHSDDLIPPEKLVKLLEHRNILTVLPSTLTPGSQGKHSHEPTLFMPSVLQCARASDLSVLTTNSDSDPAPLMLRYECGYTPVGVFPAMITNLVSQQLNDWEMIEEGLRKNKVQFHVGKDCDIVTLISHPRYFEIVISRKEEFLVPTRALCAYVRHTIESTLASVTQHLHYHFKMAYKFGFECPSHPGRAHLCILSSETAEKMMCLQNPERKEPIWLEDEHKVWFLSACEEVCSCCGSTTLGLEGKHHTLLLVVAVFLKLTDFACRSFSARGPYRCRFFPRYVYAFSYKVQEPLAYNSVAERYTHGFM